MRIYRIFIPLSKEELKRTIKRTTYELTIENQNYRNAYLSKIEDDDIYLSRSRASLDESGFEMLHLYDISECGNDILMNGGFEPVFEIRYTSLFFLIAVILAVLWFCISDGIFMFPIMTMIMILPTILIYKILPKIVAFPKGRQKILDYVENELGGKIEMPEPDKQQNWKELLEDCRNAFQWQRVRGQRSYERNLRIGNKIKITLCGENDAESVLRYIQAHAKPYNLINREMELYQVLCSEKNGNIYAYIPWRIDSRRFKGILYEENGRTYIKGSFVHRTGDIIYTFAFFSIWFLGLVGGAVQVGHIVVLFVGPVSFFTWGGVLFFYLIYGICSCSAVKNTSGKYLGFCKRV